MLLLTGDHSAAAHRMAAAAGIDDVGGESPAGGQGVAVLSHVDENEAISRLATASTTPQLKDGDVGIAMGGMGKRYRWWRRRTSC
jgi:cation transport ATPase